jgi:uncharacterized protein (TIRG00374 family)
VVLALVLAVDVMEVIRALQRIPSGVLALVLVLLSADRVMMGIKWRHLVNGAGGRMRVRDAVAIYYQSGFAALLLPTSMGGEVLRGILGRRAGVSLELVVGSMVLEKLVAGLSNLALALLGTLYIVAVTSGRDGTVILLVTVSALIVVAAIALAGSRRVHEWIGGLVRRWTPKRVSQVMDRLSASVVSYGRRKAVLGNNLLLNIGEHLLQFAALYVLARGLGIDFGLLPFLAVTAVVMLVRRTVGFLESWWLAEAAVVVLYSLFGVPRELSVGLAFALWATSILATLPGAWMLYRQSFRLGDWWARRGQELAAEHRAA